MYRQVTGIQKPNKDCDQVIGELAEILVSEGHADLALKYLGLNF